MSKCQRCSSDRIGYVDGKTADRCFYTYKDIGHDGYVPKAVGIEGGDYIGLRYCLECGQIQGSFPVQDPEYYTEIQGAIECVKSGDWGREMFREEYPDYEYLLGEEDDQDQS